MNGGLWRRDTALPCCPDPHAGLKDLFSWLLELLLAVSPHLLVLCRSAAAKESPLSRSCPLPRTVCIDTSKWEPSPFFQLGTTLKGQLQSAPWSQWRLFSQSCFSLCPVVLPSPGSDPRSICWSLSQSLGTRSATASKEGLCVE